MKSYTDLEQSNKLAEILPIESADMYYISGNEWDICFGSGVYEEIADWLSNGTPKPADIPCWSLAALLGIIRKTVGYTLQTTYNKGLKVFIVCELGDKPYSITSLEYDNEMDACYELILKLHELNLL